ncbi:MAG: hypothetical protein GWP10_06275 [Nitrospiraceae bacterium]|nr:hypothetical protein [Nitrospiraceae bacterium]
MTRYSHLWLGFIVGEKFLDINLLHPNPDIVGRYHLLALLAMLIGSYAPDLDMYFTNFKKQPFNQRTLLFSHRGWTHHILLPFVIYFIALYLHSLFLGFIALGVGFHIAFDLFSPLGVPWGWQYKQRLRFPLYYTGKSSEVLFVLAVTFCGYFFDLYCSKKCFCRKCKQ